jgi:hypothetical protein
MRRLADLVAYSAAYEFEDVVEAVTDNDRLEPHDAAGLELSRRAYRYLRLVSRSRTFASKLAPRPGTVSLTRDYDLFLPVFNHPHELYALAAVPDWRSRCQKAACVIIEAWPHLLPDYLLEMLVNFDRIYVGNHSAATAIARITGQPCSYLPLAADVLRMSPYPQHPARVIDVCNIGRRSPITHESLLALARERRLVYYYDTVAASGIDRTQRTFHVQDPREHRLLLATILQRTRFYIANRARINEPSFTVHGDEIAGRFYEGIASGTVLIGEAPRTSVFAEQFDWPDAVIPLAFDSPDAGALVTALEQDPARLARIRDTNIANAARRHDWVHRLRTVFTQLGLPPTEAMLARERRLQCIASMSRAA